MMAPVGSTALVDGGDDLGEVPGVAERDRRDQRPKPDPVGVAGKPGQDGPRVRGRHAGRPGEARVVVRAEERLQPVRLGSLGDGDVVGVAHSLLGLDLEGETHHDSCMPRKSLTLTK